MHTHSSNAALPKVTVSLITYNHARYIRQAIESVLAQQTDFPFELLIGEDQSTDGTRETVATLAEEHPGKLRIFYHQHPANHVRDHGERNLFNNLTHATGTYVALLDGDDYWCDPLKLQRQVDFMEAHPENTLCFHDTKVEFEDGRAPGIMPPLELRHHCRFEDVISGCFIHTSSMLYRRDVIPDFANSFSDKLISDWPLQIYLADKGSVGYLPGTMSVYRIHTGGVWSTGCCDIVPDEVLVRRLRVMLAIYDFMIGHFGSSRSKIILRNKSTACYNLAWANRRMARWEEMRRALWRALVACPTNPAVSFELLAKAWLIGCFPWFYLHYRNVKTWRARQPNMIKGSK